MYFSSNGDLQCFKATEITEKKKISKFQHNLTRCLQFGLFNNIFCKLLIYEGTRPI